MRTATGKPRACVTLTSEDTVDVSVSHRQALEQLLLPGQKWRVKRMRLGLFEPALLAAVARFDGFPRLRELSLTSTGAGTLDAIEALEGSRVLAGLDVLEVNVVDIATGPLTGIAAWLSPLRLRSARALERKLNIDSAQWTLRRAPEGSWRLDCWTNLSMGRADHGSLLAALPPGELETFAIEPERLSLERHAEVTAAARAVGIKQLLIKPPVVPRSP